MEIPHQGLRAAAGDHGLARRVVARAGERRSRFAPRGGARQHRQRVNVQTITTDILILGAGGAGLFAALHAKKANPELDVTIAVKGLLGKCGCTRMVQGGYNVALSPGDSVERHFMDTIEGGGWLNDQDLAWLLVETAPKRIRELETDLGCFFDRNPDGTVHQKAFAGQTFDRTVHKGDLTGIEIINRLAEQVWRRDVRRIEDHRALDLIPDRRRLGTGRRADARHALGRAAAGARARHAAGDRRRPDHVPLSHTVRRQVLRRPGDGAARRTSAARHRDGAVPPDRPARRRRHPHDRHRAGRRPARLRRLSHRRARRALHVRLRPARRTRHPRHRQPLDCGSHPQRTRVSRMAASISRWDILVQTVCAASSRAWSSVAPIAVSISPPAASR